MIGIEDIGIYIPGDFISNYDRKEQFGIDDYFIEQKTGIRKISVKLPNENASDLCIKAWNDLIARQTVDTSEIECVVVVTQNPDTNIPHVSAVVHGRLGFPETCACFDISLGCSGFVYALSVIESFMQVNGFMKGILFTADPYSTVIDPSDKNTSILFGDGAAACLIGSKPTWTSMKYSFGTIGKLSHELICVNGKLQMNGRAIFDFAARYIPRDIKALLARNNLSIDDIDIFLFHQGSKYIVDTLSKRLQIDAKKAPFWASDYGNTVSSTIPIMLSSLKEINMVENIVISGFGVGLSWGSTILKRVQS